MLHFELTWLEIAWTALIFLHFGVLGLYILFMRYVALRKSWDVEIDPNYAKAWSLMALVYLKRGNFDEARRYLRKACELGDKSSCKALRRIQSL